MELTFNNSTIDRFIDIPEHLIVSVVNISFIELSLILSLKLGWLIRIYRRTVSASHMMALVLHYLVSIVDAHNLIRLVDALAWCSAPAVEDWHFLGHVLAWLGATERKLIFLDTLTWQYSCLWNLLSYHTCILIT